MHPVSAWRALVPCCVLVVAGVCNSVAMATAPATKAHGHAAPAAAESETQVQALARRYRAAQVEVLRQQLCLQRLPHLLADVKLACSYCCVWSLACSCACTS